MSAPSPVKVLVIDDDSSVCDSFKNFLEDLTYHVFTASSGREGIQQFDQEHPDIVILDLRMPGINGHELLEKFARQSPDTPLIVASGTGNVGETIEALHLGAWDYLLKPVTDLNMLEHAIQRMLERSRLIRENRDFQQHLKEKVDRRTKELTQKVDEMSRFNRMAVGRERRIIELKRQINSLLEELGREPKFKSPEVIPADPSLIE